MTSRTYRETKEQYIALNKTKSYLDDKMQSIENIYKKHSFVIYVGCGSSYYLAKSMAFGTMTQAGIKSVALPAGDILLRENTYKDLFEGALVVVLSRSGATSEVLFAIDKLKKAGASFELLSISCNTDQELAHISDYALEIPWAFDESVCQTRTVTNLYFTGMYLLSTIAGKKEIKESLERVLEIGYEFMLQNEEAWAKIAAENWSCGVTLGDAEVSGICEEGALAFKEICQLQSNYYPVLDSRHGPIVIINNDTLVIVAISDVECAYEKALIEDLKKKNCLLVTVSDLPYEVEGTINFCINEKLTYSALGMLFINAVQLITIYKAKERSIDPDEPNGLDPWIELEQN